MTISVLPVNSSAPPTMIRIKPRQNTTPDSSRLIPNGSTPSAPASTVVANMAPSAMKAPPSTASVSRPTTSIRVFCTPIASALRAISGGSSASML